MDAHPKENVTAAERGRTGTASLLEVRNNKEGTLAPLFTAMQQFRGLVVDTGPLESILQGILQATQYHSRIVSTKLPELEAAQSTLRAEINEIKLNSASRESFRVINVVGENGDEVEVERESCILRDAEKKVEGDDEGRDSFKLPSLSSSKSISAERVERVCSAMRTFDRPRSASNIQTFSDANLIRPGSASSWHFSPSTGNSLHEVQKELRGVKAIVRQMQREHDQDLSSSMETDDRVNALKTEVLRMHRELASAATLNHIGDLHKTIQQQRDDLTGYVSNFSRDFRLDIDQEISTNLMGIKSWFKDLEGMVQQRQTKLDARMESLAKASDLWTLRSDFDSETTEVKDRINSVSDSLGKTANTLKVWKERDAITTFNTYHVKWKRRMLQDGMKRWHIWIKNEDDAHQLLLHKRKLMKNVIVRFQSGKKRKGFFKWVQYMKWHRKFEERKETALKVFDRWIQRSVSEPTDMAFRHWQRQVNLLKINDRFEKDPGAEGGTLASALEALKNDPTGVSQVLAQEIENVRNISLGRLRDDMENMGQYLSEKIDELIAEGAERTKSVISNFENRVDERLQDFADELPVIKAELFELRNTLTGTRNRVKNIEESHGERIELLFEHKEVVDERLHQLEARLRESDKKVKSLEREQSASKNAIDSLKTQISDNEEHYDRDKKALADTLSHLQQELQGLKNDLALNESRCEKLDNNLNDVGRDLERHCDDSRDEFDALHARINAPGLRKPSLDTVIKDCILYERVAKEKNFVVLINSISNGSDFVDIPEHIAAFAHDYAAWIAYQADHEALMRLIAGTNPEEMVYAEEDTGPRRKDLIECLKSDFSCAMESAFSKPGALRLEARTIFCARLIDAVDLAISKHDQVLIPATTRLGRAVKSSVPTCVACDRPLRSKTRKRRGADTEEKTESIPSGKVKPSQKATQQPVLDESYFVMRGGFKMPSTAGSDNLVPTSKLQHRPEGPVSHLEGKTHAVSAEDIENRPETANKVKNIMSNP